MTEPSPPPSERFRARLLEAMIEEAPASGWTSAALAAARTRAGLSEGEALLAAPRGVIDLADAFAARADALMAARIAALDLPAMKVRERVRAAVLARLDAQGEVKEAARAMSRALARRPSEAARLLWRTADLIWRALGDVSTDGNFYSKRAILAGVLGATYVRWFDDADPDIEPTRAFLDARIENIMQFERFKAKRLAPLGDAAADLVARAARARYGVS